MESPGIPTVRPRSPTRELQSGQHDHDRFCRNEGWTEVHSARGKKVRHHITHELELPDGAVLRTRISGPANNQTYGPHLWATIAEHQLCVSEAEFWACVSKKRLPGRGSAGPQPSANALPARLVSQLIHDAKIPEGEVARMTLDQAMAALHAYWSRSGE